MTKLVLTPGEHGGGKPAKPKPEESTPTHSPFLDFGNPPPTQTPHTAPVTSPRPADSEPSPHLTQEATRYAQPPSSDEEAERREQRLEEAKRRFEDARQTATTPPSPKVAPEPPDIAELQDDHGSDRLIETVTPEHLHRFSNLDVIRVLEDIKRRPLVFQHCFRNSASLQDAMECIYAFPPDCDEGELRYFEQVAKDQSDLRAGLAEGGTGDACGDMDNSGGNEDLAHADSPHTAAVAQESEDRDKRRHDPEQGYVEVYISGKLKVYTDETFIRGEDAPKMIYEVGDTARLFKVFRYSQLNADPFPKMLIEVNNRKVWFDPNDPETNFADKPSDANQHGLTVQQEASANRNAESRETAVQTMRAILENDYGVFLSNQRPDGSVGGEDWSDQAEAIATVLEAVRETADAMWQLRDGLDMYATPQNKASLFRTVVGPIDIRLALEAKPFYGITYAYDPDSEHDIDKGFNVIMFHEPGWEQSGDWFKYNLVHEIGHVIGNRVAGYPVDRVGLLNDQYKADPLFRTQGWGKASGEDWLEEREELRDSATPVVTRQFSPEETDPTYLANEEWADMFLFWVYDDQFGQTTFSHPDSGMSIYRSPKGESETYGQVRRRFMNNNLPKIINARFRITLSPRELVELAGWSIEANLPRVNAREDLEFVATMRIDLTGVEGLEATHINKDFSVVAGALNPGEMTTILGRSVRHPHMILTIADDGKIGWTHIGLLDVRNVELESLNPLSNDAIDELFGLED